MDFIKYCPICTGTYLESYRVCISSFLHERMFNHNSVQDCQFVRCERCDFYFFNIRPDESEMKGSSHKSVQSSRHGQISHAVIQVENKVLCCSESVSPVTDNLGLVVKALNDPV